MKEAYNGGGLRVGTSIGNTKGVMTYRDTSINHRKVWQWKICQHEKMRG